ncbi:MAG: signal transduction histidine kinase [Halocynthiibacter sp.]|jgi:signal transduction histidine kinase
MAANDRSIEELTQAGLNLIQQALSIYDDDLRLVVANRPFRAMFGLPEALATRGARFDDTIHFLVRNGEYGEVTDPDAFVAERVEQARAFEPHYIERTRSNGHVISIEGSPLPSGGWVAVYTDITSVKQQEALLRARSVDLAEKVLENAEKTAAANRRLAAANAQLEEAKHELTVMESQTRMTAQMIPAHIARIGLDRRYTFSNQRLASVLPGSRENIEGHHIREVLGEDRFTRIAPYLARALMGAACAFEFNDAASSRRVRVAFTPDLAPDGKVQGVYILSMDLTEEAQARAALAQTRRRELAAQLTSGLAHDFANLLTIILGTQSRLARTDLPKDAQELVGATTAAARRGGVLLDRLAQISGPREMRFSPTDLSALLQDIVVLARPSLPDNISLSLQAEGFDTPLMLDPGSLQDMALNLILNARDAIAKNAGEIIITARPDSDTWVEISVTDTGPGFSDEVLEHALEPFFTTKGGDGSGLGLTMVYDLANLAGGHLNLGNSETGGGFVRVRLPLRPMPLNSTDPLLILLVEDNPEIRKNVRETLIEMGHQVIEASASYEAIALLQIEGLQLVLSDISLGAGGSGLDLIPEMAKRAVRVPLRFMTSRPPSDPLFEAAQKASKQAPLAKPFTPEALAAFIASAAPSIPKDQIK